MKHYTEGWCTSTDGTEIFYFMAGPGKKTPEPDVVLVDGLGCDGFMWKYLIPFFSKRHRVIRFHHRGHGRSRVPKDLNRFAIQDMADDLVSVLDHMECNKPAIIAGHSMGVQVILETHRIYPERVAALIPTCGSFGNILDNFHDADFLKKSFPVLYRLLTGFPESVMKLWKALLPSPLAYWTALLAGELNRSLIKAEDMQPYFEHLAHLNPEVFARTLHHASAHTARDHLPNIDIPTLVLGAENDTFTPAWLSYELADHIPNSELLMIPKGSHVAPLEQPELVELRIEKFLVERLNCYSQKTRPTQTSVKRAKPVKSSIIPATARKKTSKNTSSPSHRKKATGDRSTHTN